MRLPDEKDMNLKDFIRETRYRYAEFADIAGVSTSTITNIISGKDYHLGIAGKIVKASKGCISLESLLKAIKPKIKSSPQSVDRKTKKS